MLYVLVLHLNLDLVISNQLGIVIIITLFHHLKDLSSSSSINYTQVLPINLWLANLQYFSLTLHS